MGQGGRQAACPHADGPPPSLPPLPPSLPPTHNTQVVDAKHPEKDMVAMMSNQ